MSFYRMVCGDFVILIKTPDSDKLFRKKNNNSKTIGFGYKTWYRHFICKCM